jgi:hypothetical protein
LLSRSSSNSDAKGGALTPQPPLKQPQTKNPKKQIDLRDREALDKVFAEKK